MYQPFVVELKKAIDFANEWYFQGRVHIAETYRSPERQQELFDDPKIYAAEPYRSYHQMGIAADIWIEDLYGDYSNNHEEYRRLTEIFSRFKLRYLRNKDLVHFQWPTVHRPYEYAMNYMPLSELKLVQGFHKILDAECLVYENWGY